MLMASKPAANGKGIAQAIKAKAIAVLKDPKVQEMIAEHADIIIDRAQEWAALVRNKVGSKFGQKGLERRAANLRAAVVALSRDSQDLAVTMPPVMRSLDE